MHHCEKGEYYSLFWFTVVTAIIVIIVITFSQSLRVIRAPHYRGAPFFVTEQLPPQFSWSTAALGPTKAVCFRAMVLQPQWSKNGPNVRTVCFTVTHITAQQL